MPTDLTALKREATETIISLCMKFFDAGHETALSELIASAKKMHSGAMFPASENTSKRSVSSDKPQPEAGSVTADTLQVIKQRPGLRGIEIIKLVSDKRGEEVRTKTVRTAFQRMKEKKLIVSREERWYPAA